MADVILKLTKVSWKGTHAQTTEMRLFADQLGAYEARVLDDDPADPWRTLIYTNFGEEFSVTETVGEIDEMLEQRMDIGFRGKGAGI